MTDSSQTVIDCLLRAARNAGVELLANHSVERVSRTEQNGFNVELSRGERIACDRLMLATGGCRALAAGGLALPLGHTLQPPVPSLFTFHIATPWLRELAGISLDSVQVSVAESKLSERGPLLITHQGVSGPAVLRLSAWGARALHQANYHFILRINWIPHRDEAALSKSLDALRHREPARLIVNVPLTPLPARLWERLVLASGVPRETRWANLSKSAQHQLVKQLTRTELPVSGKTLNQDEFVTCGGVPLSEVNFKTMESRVCPGLYFAGEVLDIDGVTGGFNFQAAWTTGWLAGRAMASSLGSETHDHVELRR